MRIRSLWAAVPLALASSVASFAAQPCMRPQPMQQCNHKAGEDCEAAFWDNMMWPNQYVGPSRRGICQSFDLMVNNGWRRHNLLGAHHFDRSTNELTESGRIKVQWILTQAPPKYRTIYIERATDQEQSAERLESVQQLASSISNGAAAEVRETHIRDLGRPASAVDAVFTGFSANQYIPMLPPSTGGSAAGVSGGGGGGGG